ncbi:hypothetical protein MAFF241648_21700 [Ralstonia solanacearum]|nr:hypothetical protein MAFF241648_21700 [Ralstonia solanacearum]
MTNYQTADYLSEEQRKSFDDLKDRILDLNPEENKELDALRKAAQDNKAKRDKHVKDAQSAVGKVIPAISLAELFGDKLQDILKAEGYGVAAQEPAKKAGKTAGTRKANSTRASDGAPVLITITPAQGRKWEYRKGRVFEQASDTVKTPWVYQPKQFPNALLEHGQTEASLLKHATDEAKTYFANEGKEELAKIVECAKTAKQKLDGKAKAAA